MDERIKHIFHPTDLSVASRTAFYHALRLAVAMRAKLTVMHVTGSDERDWSRLPAVRRTLATWGMLSTEASSSELAAMGLGVRKVLAKGSDPLKACMDYLERHPADMIVLASGRHQGPLAWLDRRTSTPLARHVEGPTLFVPVGVPGFVDHATGAVALRHVLLPVVQDPHPAKAMAQVRALRGVAEGPVVVNALHMGGPQGMPVLAPPPGDGIVYSEECVQGDVVEGILAAAERSGADLLVMTTKGHDGFLDMLRGDTTERVLARANCPVLAVPA